MADHHNRSNDTNSSDDRREREHPAERKDRRPPSDRRFSPLDRLLGHLAPPRLAPVVRVRSR